MDDVFRPHHQPAQAIYDAFQAEAARRGGRIVEKWKACELRAVYKAAEKQAAALGCTAPTLQDIERAEMQGLGHVDYGAKWAYAVARLLTGQ